jgi:hypothetical protein
MELDNDCVSALVWGDTAHCEYLKELLKWCTEIVDE